MATATIACTLREKTWPWSNDFLPAFILDDDERHRGNPTATGPSKHSWQTSQAINLYCPHSRVGPCKALSTGPVNDPSNRNASHRNAPLRTAPAQTQRELVQTHDVAHKNRSIGHSVMAHAQE